MAKNSPLIKAAKFVLSLAISLSFALPYPHLSSAQASSGSERVSDMTPEEMKSIQELKEAISRVEALPNDPKSNAQREKALNTAYQLLSESELMMKRISTQLQELVDSQGKVRARSNQEQVDELRHRAQVLNVVVNDLARFIGRNGGEYVAFFMVDPNGNIDERNVKSARFSVPAMPLTFADTEDTTRQKSRLHSMINKTASATLHFSNQYMIYSIATGIIAMSQLQFADISNPNALELWIKQTTDMMGAAGFAIFMAANHKVINMLRRVQSGVVPQSMIPYLGMAAGSLASSYFHDLWTDKDLWKCLRPYYNSNAKPNATSCRKAKETWIAGQHAKILQYAPTVISMLGSAALAGAVRSALAASGGPQVLKDKYLKLVSRGAQLMPKAQWSRRMMMVGGGIPGLVVAVGDFVLFIGLDAYVLHEPVNQAWQNMRMNHFDPKAFLDKRSGMHSEILFPKDDTYQIIDNALDVEATNLKSAHLYFMDTLIRMQRSKWAQPEPVHTCAPFEISEGIRTGRLKQLKDLWFWQRRFERGKSDRQLRCEVLARPADLFERYASVNREWRSILLNHYSMGQSNWLTMIEQFSTVYEASYILAKHLAKTKFEMIEKGETKRPDLSREALAKVINTTLPTGDANEDRPERVHEEHLKKTNIPTPELVDYVIASFACGPSATPTAASENSSGILDSLYGIFAGQTSGQPIITTPYGSNIRFTPPKMTNRSNAICVVFKDRKNFTNPFEGRFYDWGNDKKRYKSLADYVFDNLDPELHRKIGINHSFENWWTKHIREPIAPVWETYQEMYERFISENFVPALFERSFRYGCDANRSGKNVGAESVDSEGFRPATATTYEPSIKEVQTLTGKEGRPRPKEVTCSDSSYAYRVANGVFLSLETELRNYLRGLFAIYTSALTGVPDIEDRKAVFLMLANQLIDDFKKIDAKTLSSYDYEEALLEAEESLKALFALVEGHVLTAGGNDTGFRMEMTQKFKGLILKLNMEVLQYASSFHAMNFSEGSSARLRAKSLNTDNGSFGNNRPVSLPANRHGN